VLKYVEEHIGASNLIRVLCAFLTHQDSARNTKTSIVQSLIYQICQYDHSFTSYVVDQYELRKHRFTGQASFWDQVLEDLLDSQQSTYIILDGLDECSEQQRSGILDIVTKIISGCTAVRIMVSSRRVSDIEVSVGEIAQIIEIEDGSREDIKKFVKLKLGEWFKRIKSRAPPGMEKFIRGLEKPIVYKSEG